MRNRKLYVGMLAMVLAFGMVVIGCPSDPDYDSALNGTWLGSYGSEIRLNNGSFTVFESGIPYVRGTYTTSGNTFTMTITHIHGNFFVGLLASRWYTRTELQASVIGALVGADEIDELFAPQTSTYSLSGNTLTIDGQMYTKQ